MELETETGCGKSWNAGHGRANLYLLCLASWPSRALLKS